MPQIFFFQILLLVYVFKTECENENLSVMVILLGIWVRLTTGLNFRSMWYVKELQIVS